MSINSRGSSIPTKPRIQFFNRSHPKPHSIDINEAIDLDGLLKQIRTTTATESDDWSRWARAWGSWSVALAILSALGSGAAGATVASISELSNWEKALVVLLAFGGAALSGIAAAVGAPNQAKAASEKADQLSSLERWACLAIVEKLAPEVAQKRVRELLAWRDQIFGVTTPISLSSGVDTPVVLAPGAASF